MKAIDDLLNFLSLDVAKSGFDPNSPGEMVRSSLAGQMPGMAPRMPMPLSGAPRPQAAPVVPVERSSLGRSVDVVRYQDNPDGTTTNFLSDGSQSVVKYSDAGPGRLAATEVGGTKSPLEPSGFEDFMAGAAGQDLFSGLIGGLVNTSIAPERRRREAALRAEQEKRIAANANQTVQALIKAGAPPEVAQASVGNPLLMKQAIDTYIRAPEVVKPTDDMREYEAAVKGGFQGSFMDYQQALRKSGATQVNMAGDKAWEVERAKLGAKKLQDLADSANTTAQVVDQMETMQEALDTYNKGSIFGSGNIAPYEVQMRGFLKALGVGNAETLAGGELARSVQNQMALLVRNPESGMGMPGALSDADRTFLVQTMPGLDKSPQGNRIMIAVAKKAAQRKMEIAALAEQYAAQNGGMEGFQAYLKQWAEANPMLDDQLRAQISAAKGDGASLAATGATRQGFVAPSQAAAPQPQAAPPRRRFNPQTGALE